MTELTLDSRMDRLEFWREAHAKDFGDLCDDYYDNVPGSIGIRTKVLILWRGYILVVFAVGTVIGWIANTLIGG